MLPRRTPELVVRVLKHGRKLEVFLSIVIGGRDSAARFLSATDWRLSWLWCRAEISIALDAGWALRRGCFGFCSGLRFLRRVKRTLGFRHP